MSDRVDRALESLRRGRMVLVFDADGREGETDLTFASQFVTPEAIRTLRKEGGGLICMTLDGQVRSRLGIPFMHEVLHTSGAAYPVLTKLNGYDVKYDRSSAFSITVNHRDTFTGITDRDRARTISRLAQLAGEILREGSGRAVEAFGREFQSPGHVHLLNAADPLLRDRRGHTELTTALVTMAGLTPSATICEMMGDDGRALPRLGAKAYAEARNLVFLAGQDILEAWDRWSV